ncbi:MAG: 4Fe-4S binding protein [Clostridium sp.]|jgi:polyferredoxin|nr:4Fe-4S binding protein [Clostridium sp.]
MKRFFPLFLWLAFAIVAITLWLALDNLFYLFNFLYIGTAVSVGVGLFIRGNRYARIGVQLAVGVYMLVYLGIFERENMQIEGFWYYLFSGTFQAAVIHYLVAKIAGPFLFGRGWCGYACLTAMVLDFLPFKVPHAPRKKRLGAIRYVLFALSLTFVALLFMLRVQNLEQIMWVAFLVGNALYYALGITLAFALRDNRAFCKYICPVAVFLKPASFFAMLRVKVDETKCISCGKCERVCPMNVSLREPSRTRKNGTECILCYECSKVCPKKAI